MILGRNYNDTEKQGKLEKIGKIESKENSHTKRNGKFFLKQFQGIERLATERKDYESLAKERGEFQSTAR